MSRPRPSRTHLYYCLCKRFSKDSCRAETHQCCSFKVPSQSFFGIFLISRGSCRQGTFCGFHLFLPFDFLNCCFVFFLYFFELLFYYSLLCFFLISVFRPCCNFVFACVFSFFQTFSYLHFTLQRVGSKETARKKHIHTKRDPGGCLLGPSF